MIEAFVIMVGLYILTTALLMGMGLTVSHPWVLMLGLGMFPIPFCCAVGIGGFQLQEYLLSRPWAVRLSGIVLGMLMVIVHRLWSPIFLALWVASVGLFTWYLVKSRFTVVKDCLMSFGILAVGLGAVSNLNYLALKLVIGRLQDSSLYQSDLAIYEFLSGGPIDYHGIFPLIKSKTLFDLFQNVYSMLGFGTFLVIFIILYRKESISHFLRAFLCCYFVGIIVFVIYPSVGPFVYYPESFTPAYRDSLTYGVMKTIVNGYQSVMQQSTQLSGTAYFISFPSLHVAIAVVWQYFSRHSQIHFWMFLPISLGLIASTVFLGYHYVIDVPAGILLALGVIFLTRPKKGT
jgi:hypothetical protein